MSLARKIKRNILYKRTGFPNLKKGRTTCPKCHSKLVEKDGYGLVCMDCGYWKKPKEDV